MEKLQVHIILEIMGRPALNVQQGLNGLVQKLSNEKGIKILEQTLHEVLPVKESKDLFTSFAELTLELDSLDNYFGIIFGYMPSNIEIIHPEKINLGNDHLNVLGNRILLRLHDYDAIAKKMIVERDIVLQKLKEVAPHLFKQEVRDLAKSNKIPEAKKAKPAKKSKKKK